MKRRAVIILGVLLLWSFCSSMPDNNTNILRDKQELESIKLSSFTNENPLFDGIISSKADFSIAVKTDGKENQNLVIKLKHPFYIRKINIYLDKATAAKLVLARYSKTADFWTDFEDMTKTEVGNSVLYSFKGNNVLANYLAFIIKPDPARTNLVIQEIEVYPEMEIRLKDRYVKDHWISTDKECFNNLDTKIDTVKYLSYSKVGVPQEQRFKNKPEAVLEDELLSLTNLEPGTPYEYTASLTDYNGNIFEVTPREFMTKPLSLAYNKQVEGTFNTHYDGSSIKAAENVVTNGLVDINKSLAISGPINEADQFVIIDLGAPQTFSEVVTFWRELGYSKDFSLEVSSDKINWQNVAEHQNCDTAPKSRLNGHPIRIVDSKFASTSGRYLRLLCKKDSPVYCKHGDNKVQLFEIKVF